jgi:hypothetical protein
MRFSISYILIMILLAIASFDALAQSDDFDVLEQLIEEIAEQAEEELDYAELYENLIVYYNYPIDLNTATHEDLRKLMFLTRFQELSIIAYREKYGGFQSLYELQFVDGLDQRSLKFLLPFVTIRKTGGEQDFKVNNALKYGKHDIMLRTQLVLQQEAGYIPVSDSILAENPDKTRYLGSPYKLYARYRYHYKDKIFWGLTAEKDQGEEFFKGTQPYGFDYYSAHFQINDIGPVKTAVLGDYKIEFGQGLTMWSGMSFGKSPDALSVMKRGRGVMRYGSTNENEFFRGQAAQFRFGSFDFTEFVSYKKIDARIPEDTLEFEEAIASSFLNTGYHRTPSELATKNKVDEFIAGGNITWRSQYLKLGATAAYLNYSNPLQKSDQPYNYYEFSGTENLNAGIDYLLGIKNITAFGEFSMSQNGGYAYLNGILFDLVPEVKFTLLHRHYEPDYQAIFAVPFSEGNKAANESGFYLGATIFPVKKWRIDAYADFWRYPFIRYRVDAPSDGSEYVLQVQYYPARNVDMYWRIKFETKEKNYSDQEYGVQQLEEYYNFRVRYNIGIRPESRIEFKTRIEYVMYKQEFSEAEHGFLLTQVINYRPFKIPLRLATHFALFNTDTYNARLYSWEPDVLYAFSVPAYYSQGARVALLLKYDIIDNFSVWLRYANTFFYDKDVIGSGLSEVQGNNKSEVKFQLRYTF